MADSAATAGPAKDSRVLTSTPPGTTIPTEPYVTDMTAGDWKQIFELEAEWKKKKNYT